MPAAQTVFRLAFAEILQNDGNLLRLKMTAAHFYRFSYQRQVKREKKKRRAVKKLFQIATMRNFQYR